MTYITNKQALSEVKNCVTKLGFTFKVNNNFYINGKKTYKLCLRGTNEVVTDRHGHKLDKFTIDSGYNYMLEGVFNAIKQDNENLD